MNKLSFGISDDEFIRDQVPMTKEDIRILTLSKLNLCPSDVVLDIGAGTGAMTIECARLLDTSVYALECNPIAQDLIERNIEKFAMKNINLIKGSAPEDLPKVPITKVIIGGTKGKMFEILKALNSYDIKKLVINTITIENTYLALKALQENAYENIQITQVNIAKSHSINTVTLMKSQNPISIITGEKK